MPGKWKGEKAAVSDGWRKRRWHHIYNAFHTCPPVYWHITPATNRLNTNSLSWFTGSVFYSALGIPITHRAKRGYGTTEELPRETTLENQKWINVQGIKLGKGSSKGAFLLAFDRWEEVFGALNFFPTPSNAFSAKKER